MTGPAGGPRLAHRFHWYWLVAELALRIGIPGCLGLVDRRAAVRAVRGHGPGRPGLDARPGWWLRLRLLLALEVIVQRAFLQRRDVQDHPAAVGGVVADRHPFSVGQEELDLGYPVRVTELLSLPHLCELPRFLAAGRRLVQVRQFLGELGRLVVLEPHSDALPAE
jgi:hypothetical protein